jgi:hypothetical protein
MGKEVRNADARHSLAIAILCLELAGKADIVLAIADVHARVISDVKLLGFVAACPKTKFYRCPTARMGFHGDSWWDKGAAQSV